MGTQVHTLRYGDPPWLAECAPTLDAWCARHGLPLTVWGNDFPHYPHPKFCEIDMLRAFLAGDADRIIYVDADVFIHPLAPLPDLSHGGFAIARDKRPHYPGWHRWMDAHAPHDDRTGWIYRNAGVWIADRPAAAAVLARALPPYIPGTMEQDPFNLWLLRAWRDGMPLFDLPPEWNVQLHDQDGWFFHLTGKRKQAALGRHRGSGRLPHPWRPVTVPDVPAAIPRAIVIPWTRARAKWTELVFAIRSIHQYFTDPACPIFILSDTPPAEFFDLHHPAAARLRHLPCAAYADCLTTGTRLAEEILWWNDDICLLRPMGWEDFAAGALCLGEETRAQSLRNCAASNSWRRHHGLVCMDFRHRGQAPFNFSTHTPYLFRRPQSAAVLARFGAFHKLAFETAYHNLHRTMPVPIGRRRTRDPACPHATFLNYHDAHLTPAFKSALMNRFPVPLPFEHPLPSPVPAFDLAPYAFVHGGDPMSMDEAHIHILHRLALLPQVRIAVEVGCYRGASTSALVEAVNLGALDHLHLVETNPRPELRRVIALCRHPERITLHTRPYWELGIGDAHLVFIDGDHRWPAVADVFHALSRAVPLIVMHDSNSWPAIKGTWGAAMAAENLRRMPHRRHIEDSAARPNMHTHRGLLASAADAFLPIDQLATIFQSSFTTS